MTDRTDPPGAEARPAYAIKLGGVLIPLRQGETLVGRGSSSDIVLPSEKASRAHARITVVGSAVNIEDLNSRNGVFVNDLQIAGVTRLSVRDRLQIGDTTMRLVHFDDMKRTRSGDGIGDVDPSGAGTANSNRPAPGLEMVGPLVQKMLALGKKEEAERLLRAPLQRLLVESVQGETLPAEVTTQAASLAVQVAAATGRPQFVDLILRVHAAHNRPLPIAVIDDLYRTLRAIRGVDRGVLQDYIEGLEAGAAGFGPTERFALSRLIGLQKLARA